MIAAPDQFGQAGDLLTDLQALRERVAALEAGLQPVLAEAEYALEQRNRIAAAIDEFHAATPGTPQHRVRRLAGIVAEEWGVDRRDLFGPSRAAINVRPRFVLCWLLRHATNWSLPQIGRFLGGRDHTTVKHALNRVDDWRDREDSFRRITDMLLRIALAMNDGRARAAPADGVSDATPAAEAEA